MNDPSPVSEGSWLNCRATQISTAVSSADALSSQGYVQAPWHWHLPLRFSSGLWGMLMVAGTVTLRLKVQALSTSWFSGALFISNSLDVCCSPKAGCVCSPYPRSEWLSSAHLEECFTGVIVSCWLVWACRVSPADLLVLTKTSLWLFFVWESDFHCFILFIYFI